MKVKMIKLISAICMVMLLMVGCNAVETVSKDELITKAKSQSANTAIYYKGSSDKYDYFTNTDGKHRHVYRVKYGAIRLDQRFQLTENSNQWVALGSITDME